MMFLHPTGYYYNLDHLLKAKNPAQIGRGEISSMLLHVYTSTVEVYGHGNSACCQDDGEGVPQQSYPGRLFN